MLTYVCLKDGFIDVSRTILDAPKWTWDYIEFPDMLRLRQYFYPKVSLFLKYALLKKDKPTP